MTSAAPVHPRDVLYQGERAFPILPAVDHYAGSEKLMRKALALQGERGPVFDLTCDCEDGAAAGNEDAHRLLCAAIINDADNLYGRIGVRIHDVTHAHWKADMDVIVGEAGDYNSERGLRAPNGRLRPAVAMLTRARAGLREAAAP